VVIPAAVLTTAVVAYLVAVGLPGRDSRDEHTASTADRATTPAPVPPPAATTTPTAAPTPSRTPAHKRSPATPTRTPSPSKRPTTTAGPYLASGSAPLAQRIQPGTTYTGVATVYQAGNGDGACSFGASDDMMIAAMNVTDWETSKACGAYVLVRAANGATVTVRITNECPAPCAPRQLDLSQQAFAKLVDPKLGRIPVTWRLLSPSSAGTISVRYKTGSSQWWCGVQVLGHRNPVARLEVRTSGGSWKSLPRTGYNYFLSDHGSGCGGRIRITDIYGQRLVITGIAVRPNVVQPTRLQFAAH
jgi:expansin (peptidoglycan-binding protein)